MTKKPDLPPSTFVIAATVVGILIYHFWMHLVGFLALCGAYYLVREYLNQKNGRHN